MEFKMGEITIRSRTLADGRIVYEYAFELASVDGKRKWKTKSGFKTKKEAREAGRVAKEAYETVGTPLRQEDISFSDFLDLWMKYDCAVSCKASTYKGYEKKVRLHIKPALGHLRLRSLSKEILQDFITSMYNDGYAVKSLSYAVDNHYILNSPANRLITPVNKKPATRTRKAPNIYIPAEDMKQILERFPEGNPFHIPLMIGYHCGLRIGEIYALTWDDIDLDKGTLYVNKQVQWHQNMRSKEEKEETNGQAAPESGYWFLDAPKYKSFRTVDMDTELLELLKREKTRQDEAKGYFKGRYARYFAENEFPKGETHTEDLIPENQIGTKKTPYEIAFLNRREDGTYISSRTAMHGCSIIHHKLGLSDFTMHSLRHTHATMLIEHGADMLYVQKRLGHKNMKETVEIYTNHLTETIKERGKGVIEKMYQ
jgi:integrase